MHFFKTQGSRKNRNSITEQQFKNRMILCQTMLRHDFKPLATVLVLVAALTVWR